MTKALFFDIDGTLVSFETHRIPSSTIEALEAARAKGLKIFIATGRPKAIINNLSELQDRNLIDGYITMNGAYCFVGEQVIYKSAIPQDEVKAMGDFCEKKGVPCIFVEEHNISVCQPNDMVKKIFYDFLHVNVIPTVSFEEVVDNGFRTSRSDKYLQSFCTGGFQCLNGRRRDAVSFKTDQCSVYIKK
jgi:hydroxymethylpyrimidine pyrophosphatase-like HAD family hydrolase